jgi:hypothetical protein
MGTPATTDGANPIRAARGARRAVGISAAVGEVGRGSGVDGELEAPARAGVGTTIRATASTSRTAAVPEVERRRDIVVLGLGGAARDIPVGEPEADTAQLRIGAV